MLVGKKFLFPSLLLTLCLSPVAGFSEQVKTNPNAQQALKGLDELRDFELLRVELGLKHNEPVHLEKELNKKLKEAFRELREKELDEKISKLESLVREANEDEDTSKLETRIDDLKEKKEDLKKKLDKADVFLTVPQVNAVLEEGIKLDTDQQFDLMAGLRHANQVAKGEKKGKEGLKNLAVEELERLKKSLNLKKPIGGKELSLAINLPKKLEEKLGVDGKIDSKKLLDLLNGENGLSADKLSEDEWRQLLASVRLDHRLLDGGSWFSVTKAQDLKDDKVFIAKQEEEAAKAKARAANGPIPGNTPGEGDDNNVSPREASEGNSGARSGARNDDHATPRGDNPTHGQTDKQAQQNAADNAQNPGNGLYQEYGGQENPPNAGSARGASPRSVRRIGNTRNVAPVGTPPPTQDEIDRMQQSVDENGDPSITVFGKRRNGNTLITNKCEVAALGTSSRIEPVGGVCPLSFGGARHCYESEEGNIQELTIPGVGSYPVSFPSSNAFASFPQGRASLSENTVHVHLPGDSSKDSRVRNSDIAFLQLNVPAQKGDDGKDTCEHIPVQPRRMADRPARLGAMFGEVPSIGRTKRTNGTLLEYNAGVGSGRQGDSGGPMANLDGAIAGFLSAGFFPEGQATTNILYVEGQQAVLDWFADQIGQPRAPDLQIASSDDSGNGSVRNTGSLIYTHIR